MFYKWQFTKRLLQFERYIFNEMVPPRFMLRAFVRSPVEASEELACVFEVDTALVLRQSSENLPNFIAKLSAMDTSVFLRSFAWRQVVRNMPAGEPIVARIGEAVVQPVLEQMMRRFFFTSSTVLFPLQYES